MTLTPAVVMRLGAKEYATHSVRARVRLAPLPGVDHADARLPVAAEVDAGPGDEAVLTLDGGEGVATVLTGTVHALVRGVDHTTVRLVGTGGTLAARRPGATFEKLSPGDVINALCAEAGVNADVVTAGDTLPAYVADQGRTVAEHVGVLARLAGAVATVSADGTVRVAARPTGQADIALRYGRELADYDVRALAPPTAPRIAVGHGAGTPSAPDALRPTVEPLNGGAADPPDAVWLPTPALRSPAGVQAAGDGLAAAAAAATVRLRATCWLQPALRPGTLVEVQDLPDHLDAGPWYVTDVRHTVDPHRGARTVIVAEAGGAAAVGLLALAGSLLGGLL